VKWFYNAETDSCEEFTYGGCDGNRNNFDSQANCEEICAPPPPVELPCCDPLKEPGALGNPPSFEGHACCPDGSWGLSIGDNTNFACGQEVLTNPDGKICDICSLPSDPGPCEAIFVKWFYNAETDSCEEFTYGGCDGNRNNFDSQANCEEICAPPPPVELPCCDPLQEPGVLDNPPSLEGHRCCPDGSWGYSIGTPFEFACGEDILILPNGKVCDDVCSLPKEVGPCEALIPRWYYDTATEKCESFTYGGCEGNRNNFESEKACESVCPPITCCDFEERLDCPFDFSQCCPDGTWSCPDSETGYFMCEGDIVEGPLFGPFCPVKLDPSEPFPECFPASSTVVVKGSGVVPMKDLRIGDEVLVADSKYEPVYSFGHYKPKAAVEMLQITTSNKSTVRLSRDHLIYVASRNTTTIPARHVRIGDQLVNTVGDVIIVTSVKVVPEYGLYAPFTSSGTLIVDGILVSSYATMVPATLEYVSIFGIPFSYYWVYHMAISPYRLLRKYSSANYHEKYDSNTGINSDLISLMNAARPLLQSKSFLANFSVLMIITLSYGFYATAIFSTTADGNISRYTWILSVLTICTFCCLRRLKNKP